ESQLISQLQELRGEFRAGLVPRTLIMPALGKSLASERHRQGRNECVVSVDEKNAVALGRLHLAGYLEHRLFADVPGLVADTIDSIEHHQIGQRVAQRQSSPLVSEAANHRSVTVLDLLRPCSGLACQLRVSIR